MRGISALNRPSGGIEAIQERGSAEKGISQWGQGDFLMGDGAYHAEMWRGKTPSYDPIVLSEIIKTFQHPDDSTAFWEDHRSTYSIARQRP
jgi:hypothetical protein